MKKPDKKKLPKKASRTPAREIGKAQLNTIGVTMGDAINQFAGIVHRLNDQWWRDPKSGRRIKRNKPELIALMHSELSECLEAVRKDLKDDKLPQWDGEVIEMADLIIRAFDYCSGFGLPLGEAIVAKLHYNYSRADHQPKNRLLPNGKKF